jgi:hypothetical protein
VALPASVAVPLVNSWRIARILLCEIPSDVPRPVLPGGERAGPGAIFGRRVLQNERRRQIGRHALAELGEIAAFAGGLN